MPYRNAGGGGGGGGGDTITTAATWGDLPTTGTEGDRAYLQDAQILLRWSADIDPLDAVGRQWVPDAIYSSSTGTGVVAGVVEWLEPIDCAGVGDGQPVATWPSRAGTGDYTAAGTARPAFDEDGGADGGAAVVFDGANNVMAKGLPRTLVTNRTAYSILSLNRPASVTGTGFVWLASMAGSSFARYALARNGATHAVYLDSGGTNSINVNVPAQPPAATTWRLIAHHCSSAGYGAVARSPAEQGANTATAPSGCAGASDYVRLGGWGTAATPSDPWAGRMGPFLVLAGTGSPTPGAARAVAAWLSSRAGLI